MAVSSRFARELLKPTADDEELERTEEELVFDAVTDDAFEEETVA